MAGLIGESNIKRLDVKNIEDLNATFVDRTFGRPGDYIEIFISDLNDKIISTIPNYTGYKAENSAQGLSKEINIDPLSVLNGEGFKTGVYKLIVNIQKRKIFNSSSEFSFGIKTISPTRTELKLYAIRGGNTRLDSNSRNFINAIQNSLYFRDFTLNFGRNVNVTAVNIDIDRSGSEFLLNIKLLKPLQGNIEEGDKLNIVEDIIEPIVMTYDLGALPLIDTGVPLRGPNFKIDTRLNSKVPEAFKSYDDILTTATTSSYQKLLSKLDGYEIPEIDYGYVRPIHSASLDFETITPSHFENFIHFGSATELLKNFEYKLKLIEIYNQQLNDLYSIPGGLTPTATVTTEATASILEKKENLIQGFSGYEQFLYFTTGSNTYTWPKTNHTEPYELASTISEEAKTWLGHSNSTSPYYGGQLLSASIFDKQNPNRLFKLTPTFIGDKDENRPYELFCDMVGQHFDPIWTHIKEYSQIRDNSHTLGVSKDLVFYALENLGIEAYDQFENEDLISYVFGQNLTPLDTSTVVTASNEIISKQNISKEVWKRLYHNAPYLLKTKGTERGLRALINCYGIPNTVLDIKEFGSSNPNQDNIKLYTYEKFTQVLTGDSLDGTKRGMFIQTQWSSSNTNALSSSAKTVEFRIKPTRLEKKQHLFSLTSQILGTQTGSDIHLILQPYTSSDDFYITDDKNQFGRLELQQFTESISNTEYFNIYNKEFWDITISTDGISGSDSTITYGAYQANHLRDVLHYTQSTAVSEKTNAESFGNPYYNGFSPGVANAFIGGIKDTISNGISTSSLYTNNETSSFDLGYEGSLSEVRYYFGEQLSHKTLELHALEPLLYGGNSISSSYDHLILRYPLSFELSLINESDNQLPSSSYAWNSLSAPLTPGGTTLTGPITGGAVISASGYYETGSAPYQGMANQPSSYGGYSGQPFSSSGAFIQPPSGSTLAESFMFTVAGTPLLSSHHPNQDINYLNGFTYFQASDVELLNETHHLPTPNTIGKSPVNQKVYIDSGSTDDDILSPDILSQLPITERQVPDFSNVGVFLSPQNEINEDIIYTLGSFSLDEFLGDPREETLDKYTSFEPLATQYFKKLKRGKDRYNIWDFTRWMQFLDHTLFELIKKFTPQKSIDKTGLLIEPHFLERPKFQRYHPITSRPEYNGTIQEVTASFHKKSWTGQSGSGFYENTNTSQLNGTTGSAVLSQYNFIGTGSDGKALRSGYDTTIDVAKALSGSSTWEQGPLVPNSTGSVKQRNSSGSNVLRSHVLTPRGNFMNSKVSKKRKKPLFENRLGPELLNTSFATSIGTGATLNSSNKVTFVADAGADYVNPIATELVSGRKYKVQATISGYSDTSGTDSIGFSSQGGIPGTVGVSRLNADGDISFTFTSDGDGVRIFAGDGVAGVISNMSLREINPQRDVEFDDALLDSIVWKRSRYEGSRLTGAKINEYTAGDITYGLNPVVEQPSVALYFGKTLIGAGGTEDDSLATIKNHSYVDIEKIILINKRNDDVTTIDLKNETYKGINGYIARDFKDGSGFNIELLDDKITHKLKDTYKAKFNQGYLYKILEHKGINGSGNIFNEGIQVGYIDSSSKSFSDINLTGSAQNYLVYGNYNNTMNSDTLILKSNTLTKKIFPQDFLFGAVDYVSSSAQHYVYDNMTHYSSFVNSLLIPMASESQYRLFGTVQEGQPVPAANYSSSVDAGIRSISTFEFDLNKYNISSSGASGVTMHTLISASSGETGNREILQPHSFAIPIMQGPHDVISNFSYSSGGDTSNHASTSNGEIELEYLFSGNSKALATYQISYLEKTNTIIADIDKPNDLANDVGDNGYVLIPDNLDKDIKYNLDFYLDKAGLKESPKEKSPPRGN